MRLKLPSNYLMKHKALQRKNSNLFFKFQESMQCVISGKADKLEFYRTLALYEESSQQIEWVKTWN